MIIGESSSKQGYWQNDLKRKIEVLYYETLKMEIGSYIMKPRECYFICLTHKNVSYMLLWFENGFTFIARVVLV